MKRTLQALVILLLAAGGPAQAAEVSGRVAVKGRPRSAHVITVVYLESLDGPTPDHPGRYALMQKNKTFIPSVLAIPAGSTVNFPNEDPIFHNVFSLSPPAPFDLGLYRSGASKSRVFKQPSTYRVFCNIHSQMTAVILVLSTSYITQADSSGHYQIKVPPGKYRVTAWSERSKPNSVEVTVGSAPVTAPDIALDESQYVAEPHLNKYGKPYSTETYNPLGN